MQIALFILYLLLGFLFLWYYKFEKNTGLPIQLILVLFLIKVAAGTLNMYIHFHEYISNDIGFFHWQSVNELKAMDKHPAAFFYEWLFNWGDFRSGFDISSPLFTAFWKDLGVLMHTKYMTFANILSLGNQYVNGIVYNIPFFVGQLFLYKTLYRLQPEKKWIFVFVIFLVPSVLFWCSGIHKDGWVLTAFGFIFYSLSRYLQTKRMIFLPCLLMSLFLLFVVRYFYLLALLPLLLLWVCTNNTKYKLPYFLLALFFTGILFFNFHRLIPSVNPMKAVQSRQAEFFGYIGYSDMKTPKLENHFESYVQNLPTALNHIFLQPAFNTSHPLKYQVSAIDNYMILLCIFVLVFFMKRKNFSNAMLLVMLFYALSIYLFIGYTIPNCGALVRYKSEFTVLLLASLVGLSEMPALNRYLNQKSGGENAVV